tara:strand:- start:19 stop:576 length:558 start_codon:yes stop_codon:yes gene_type:complete
MKTLFKNILVLAVMLGTYTGYANEKLEVLPTFNNVKKGNSITVTDAKGVIIFSGRINYEGNLSRLYDFTQLKDGIYQVEVNKDYQIEISIVAVKGHTVSFINSESKKVFKPVFRVEGNTVIISKIAIDSPEMEIELYYDNELIYSETAKGSQILNRVYKLDNSIKGEYSAVVKSNGRVYIKNFIL